MRQRVDELVRFADGVRTDGYARVAVLGMGGSSLAPELFGIVFGRPAVDADATDGPPRLPLRVLDSTHPDVVRDFRDWATAARTLFIVSSKSGTTTEPLAFHAAMAAVAPSRDFVAITDPGTPLAELGRHEGFRAVVDAPPDVGGRYSALTTFGLLPAALAGVDIGAVLDRAAEMAERCRQPASNNPALRMAAAIGESVLGGRDKLTVMATQPIAPFADWAEQLIAESTGKLGRGLVPVVGERIGEPASYGDDRYFVTLRLRSEAHEAWDLFTRELGMLGHPGHTIRLRDTLDVGAEFFRWEFATAALGIVLEIDPFDQPNVQESKDATTALLEAYRRDGVLPQPDPVASDAGMTADAASSPPDSAASAVSGSAASAVSGSAASASVADPVRRLLASVGPGDYFAILAYLPPTDEVRGALDELRTIVRERLGVATTLGFGPRFLHSTGQLHKGGPPTGVFLQLTADPVEDTPIPGWSETFATLIAAQALGDLESLQRRGRRALRVHLRDVMTGLGALVELARGALTPVGLPEG